MLDPSGEVRATIAMDELYDQLEAQTRFTERSETRYHVVTTADGSGFSVESVAELLGLAGSDVSFVPRVATDGRTVVVTVALEERHADGSRKQVVLAGTPIT